ncbi:outer membrane protein [Ensifer adhaerens]|uniref:outer membrane protein n=1 Tax=Ensifer adhaerens TaxID=106592 RepID=UPI000CF04945|nr:outer membrane beta-barrel protein [Ensifer adhaerens]
MKRHFLALAAAICGGIPAAAADLYVEPDPVVVPVGGWYLRGYLGMSNQRLGSLENADFSLAPFHELVDEGGFNSAPLGGIGVGYQFNDWLRMDGIVEYRGKADFSALDRYTYNTDASGNPIWEGTNDYDGAKSEWLLMANAYVDLGDWYGVVPYIGAGIGASRNTISGFRDVNVPKLGLATADSDPTWNFAWALHAGVGYKASDRLTLDVGYSYMNLGDAKTKEIRSYDGKYTSAPMHFKDITSHDFKVGLRYALE